MTGKIQVTVVCSMIAIMLLGIVVSARAGWVMEERNGDRALISGGKIKAYSEDEVVIFDSKTKKMTFLNDAKKTYVQGTLDEICGELKGLQERMMASMPPEMRETIQKKNSVQDVTVKKTGGGGAIAGQETVKYDVFVDGERYEEMWVAKMDSLLRELGPLLRDFEKFERCAAGIAGDNGPESSPQYLEVISKGVVLKSVRYDMGMPETDSDVVKIEEQSISAEEFQIPGGYRKTSYSEMVSEMMDSMEE